jgi:protein gp37
MNETTIEWTSRTWNPFSGCEKISDGCAFCYAHTLAEPKRGTPAFPNGFDLTLRPHKLGEPHAIKEGALIFLNSMSDFAWDKVDDSVRDQIVDVVEATPRHEYQVLTKRPDNLLRYSKRRKLPRNFWAGVTLEHERYLSRVDVLRQIDVEIRFLSCEPLLSSLVPGLDLDGISWVIAGGESGNHLVDPKVAERRALVHKPPRNAQWVPRPDRAAWVRSLRDLCEIHDVAYFFKQWGGTRPKSGGADLDGRTWKNFPRLQGRELPAERQARSLLPIVGGAG